MNHFADIVDGVEAFDDEKERQAAEVKFRENPAYAVVMLDNVLFEPSTVKTVHLLGSLRHDRRTTVPQPFDFEEGYLEATGLFVDGRTGKIPVDVAVRWSDFGQNVQW